MDMYTLNDVNEYLTPKEAMKVLRCKNYSTLWKRLDRLGIAYIKINGTRFLIPKKGIEEALNGNVESRKA